MSVIFLLRKRTTLAALSDRFKNCFTALRNTKKYCSNSNSKSSFEVNTNVIKDVILFKYDNPRFYKILNIFAICQFGFWSYLSVTAFTTLRNVPTVEDKSGAVPWWMKINLGENKYRITFTVLSFLVGYGVLSISWLYTLRSIRYLILRKGGNQLTLVTYGPFGKNRMFTVDLKDANCKTARTDARAQLPIKVRGHYFHYILDMKGEFKNAPLFDNTAGLRRKF